jgi:hypothetical protein
MYDKTTSLHVLDWNGLLLSVRTIFAAIIYLLGFTILITVGKNCCCSASYV